MQVIDFLPEHYRERRQAAAALRWWWALVVSLFGGLVATTFSLQWLNVQRIKSEVAKLETQVATARQLDLRLLEIETKVSALSHSANLYTFLRHPWPRTQILHAVVHPLPADIELSSVRIAESLVAKPTMAAPEASDDAKAPAPHPAVADCCNCTMHESLRVIVIVEGTAKEVETLHAYLEALGRHPLIVEARLNSLETRKLETSTQIVFQLQLNTKPGHGLSDGPIAPLLPNEPAATATIFLEALR